MAEVQCGDVVGLHRRAGRARAGVVGSARRGRVAARRGPDPGAAGSRVVRQRQQVTGVGRQHPHDAPGALGGAPRDPVGVQVVTGPAAALRPVAFQCQRVLLAHPVVQRVQLAADGRGGAATGVALHAAVAGQGHPVVDVEALTLEAQRVKGRTDVDGPHDQRVTRVAAQQRGLGVAVGVRGVAVGCARALGEGRGLQVDRGVVTLVVVVDRPQGQLAEAAVDVPGQQVLIARRGPVGNDVGNRTRLDLGTVVARGVELRSGRLDDELPDQAVAPAVDAVDVVVPEDVVQLRVGVPLVLDELEAGAVGDRVGVLERCIQGDGAARRVNSEDLPYLDPLAAHADSDERMCGCAGRRAVLELGDAGELQAGGTAAGRLRQRRVLDLVGPDGVLVGKAGRDAVRALHVELHVVDVHRGLGPAVEGARVRDLIGERDLRAVTDVDAQGQRLGCRVAVDLGLVLGEREQLALTVGDGGAALHGGGDGDDVEVPGRGGRAGPGLRWAEPVGPIGVRVHRRLDGHRRVRVGAKARVDRTG